jgi:PIN domain nuclease of toxin-antitoxin system
MAEKPPAFLLDASALLAYLQREPGFVAVQEALREGAGISAVNLAEVVGKLKAKGKDPDRILRRLLAMGLEVLPFTLEEALEAGALDPLTRPLGLAHHPHLDPWHRPEPAAVGGENRQAAHLPSGQAGPVAQGKAQGPG